MPETFGSDAVPSGIIVKATLVAGSLDILAATVLTLIHGRPVDGMLRFVASGPFPAATGMGSRDAVLGLLVHFALMAIVASVYVMAVRRLSALREQPVKWGVLYGLATYVVMNLIVVPLRFAAWPPKPVGIVTQLFCHIVLVGIPIATIAARAFTQTRTSV